MKASVVAVCLALFLAESASGLIDVGPAEFTGGYDQFGFGQDLIFDTDRMMTVDAVSGEPMSPSKAMVIVPGLMGSRLYSGNNIVWARVLYPDKNLRENCIGRFNPATDLYEPLNPSAKCETVLNDEGLTAISVIGEVTSRVGPLEKMWYFYDLIQAAKKMGFVPGKTLFGAPYNWLQSNGAPEQLAKLQAVLVRAKKESGGKSVILSHSMGGVRTKILWAAMGKGFEDLVQGWVPVSAPFRGSAMLPIKGQMVGEDIGLIKTATVQGFMLGSPFAFELMVHGIKLDDPPTISYNLNGAATKISVDTSCQSYADVAREGSRDIKVLVTGSTYAPMPFDETCWERSKAIHALMDNFKSNTAVRVVPIHSYGKATPRHLTFVNALKDVRDLYNIKQPVKVGTGDGDGTVHIESMTNSGLVQAAGWKVKGVAHGDTVKTKAVMEKVFAEYGIAVSDEAFAALFPPTPTEEFESEQQLAASLDDLAAMLLEYEPEWSAAHPEEFVDPTSSHPDMPVTINLADIDPDFEWEELDPETGLTTPMKGASVHPDLHLWS